MLRSLSLVVFVCVPATGCIFGECETIYYSDADGDGFGDDASGVPKCPANVRSDDVVVAGDCDDDDPATFPGAPEACDLVDRDCDGVLSADATDGDGDGFSVCDGDCQDFDPAIFPGAPERCNELDDDCDGQIEPPSLYDDGDEDGFTGCEGDCDDVNPLVNPDAEDICNGIDDDCTGGADSGLDAFEPNDTPQQAFDLGTDPFGVVVNGAFTSAEDPADWFAFVANDIENTVAQSFSIEIGVSLRDSPLGARVVLRDELGAELDTADVVGPVDDALVALYAPFGSDLTFTGTYQIEVVPVGGAEQCEATYQLIVDVTD